MTSSSSCRPAPSPSPRRCRPRGPPPTPPASRRGRAAEARRQRPQPIDRRLLLHGLPGVLDELLGACLLVHRHASPSSSSRLVDLICERVELVAGVDLLAQPRILVAVLLGVAHHALDLALVQVGALADRDLLLGPGVLVARRHVENAVGVDVERHLDLRLARAAPAGCPRAGSGRARGCRMPSRARPGARRCRPRSGCPPRCRTSRSDAPGWSCCAR